MPLSQERREGRERNRRQHRRLCTQRRCPPRPWRETQSHLSLSLSLSHSEGVGSQHTQKTCCSTQSHRRTPHQHHDTHHHSVAMETAREEEGEGIESSAEDVEEATGHQVEEKRAPATPDSL